MNWRPPQSVRLTEDGFQSTRAKLICLAVLLAVTAHSSIGLADEDRTGEKTDPSSLLVNRRSVQPFLDLYGATPATAGLALLKIDQNWQPSSAIMLLEAMRFSKTRQVSDRAISILQKKTGQTIGSDVNDWYRWVWRKKYELHPDYAKFKSQLYSNIDPRFAEYFEQPDNPLIRLDEIRWGGVKRDGIPPLKNPKMLAASDATYLADTDVVFGVNLNGDSRCYPKRILAWHEMFKDTIGGEPVCGAY